VEKNQYKKKIRGGGREVIIKGAIDPGSLCRGENSPSMGEKQSFCYLSEEKITTNGRELE